MLTQRFALTLTLIIALAAGCGGLEQAPAWQGYDQNQSGKADKVPAPATVLTTADNGKTLQVQPGDRVQVELASNPTTGFAWHLAKSSLVLESSDYIPDQPAQVGSGGIERLVLQVPASAAPGSIHELRLDYYRSWEGPSSAVETFKVTLIVP